MPDAKRPLGLSEAKDILGLPTVPATPLPPAPPQAPREMKHGTEVVLWSPGFSVSIKGETSVDHAIQQAERLFAQHAPNAPQSGPTGFANTERGPGFEAPGSSMLYPPQVTS